MSWWGKVIGGTFGFMLGGPLGAALGAALGHNFDKGLQGMHEIPHRGRADQARWNQDARVETVQSAFFTATFAMMGHLAKADGLVSREEIAVAEAVMQQMRLQPSQKKLAMSLFAEGKENTFPVEDALQQLRKECHRSAHLLQMFMEILIATALADGALDAAERRVLEHSARTLGFTDGEYQQILRRLQASQHMHQGGKQSASSRLADAYKLLGVTREASDHELKTSYRRLMNQHHPDKLVAKGLPREMMDMASKKTMEIKEAYELIRKHREQ
jgi:DnaJ like chaperone protein